MFGVDPKGRSELETGREGIRKFREFLDEIKMPKTFGDLGIGAGDIPQLLKSVIPNNGDLLGYFQPLTEEDVVNIFELCL